LKDPLVFTQKLLELWVETEEMVKYSFGDARQFKTAVDHSFRQILNSQVFTPTYLSNFIDNEMRKGLKGVSNQEVESRLTSLVKLFQCLHARDLFIKSYERELANRLLNKTSIS
jgi:cullin 3